MKKLQDDSAIVPTRLQKLFEPALLPGEDRSAYFDLVAALYEDLRPRHTLDWLDLKRNYPRPRQRGSGADGCEDRTEDSGPGRQASGVDHGAHGGFALRGPHRPVAVGDLALDDGRSQGPLAGVVGHFDPTGMIQEGQELIARTADLGLERPGQVATARGGEDDAQLLVECPALGGQR